MNYNNDEYMWDWRCDEYCLEDNADLDISNCLLSGDGQNEHFPYIFNDETTPIKACGDLAYHVNVDENSSKELNQCKEASLQAKRRRTLQFESEDLVASFCNEGISSTYLKSKETEDSVEEAISEMSNWVSGFAEGTSASGDDILDQSSEGWLADCINDAEIQFSSEDINSSGASDVQIDVAELCGTPPEYEANAIQERPVRTCRNVVFKGRKSYMRPPPKLASSVVYPFAFIKPCGVHGDVTLKDINQRLRDPPSKLKQNQEDPSVSYPTSAFSGKPVVGKTKIRTEGGKGSITIMRTKG
ncbi:protein XRI1-like [Coffea eugenioides]|uniref:protein XRI1-like n=1 Tax=Coffea eugenioides TaxID=49369 RepID=UPI000F60E6C0|nr:protein XRI1-like [Coffea eugenioides]